MTTTLPPTPDVAQQPRLRRVTCAPGPRPRPTTAPPRSRPVEPPPPSRAAREFVEAHRAVSRILRLALEVLDGRRPPVQLAPHLTDAPSGYWRALTARRIPRAPARIGRLRLCLPRFGVAEVAAACHVDGRVHALAARFERAATGWRCTELRLL